MDITRSRQSIDGWFAQVAPPIWWDAFESPIGVLYLAASTRGLCRIDLFGDWGNFLARLDPLARTERNPKVLAPVTAQLAEYFGQERRKFDITIDLEHVASFQRGVLKTALSIPSGSVWTYQRVAQEIGKPKASRAVGQALGRNPIPIVVPCHRVIGSDGSLHGYAGGLERKRMLLELEGAL
ncbi:MAG: methylated-DNA--[protein]-cysteine S-methyltransferase [Anaerolineae bacterium]|nr:methylated-DNA--[protein]-cysteine S-methyltransferase [Anaerolineae bacterium]